MNAVKEGCSHDRIDETSYTHKKANHISSVDIIPSLLSFIAELVRVVYICSQISLLPFVSLTHFNQDLALAYHGNYYYQVTNDI